MNNQINLYIDQGSDWSTGLDFSNDDGTPVNITGYSFFSNIKTSYYTSNVLANLVVTALNPIAGNAMISLAGNVSANLSAGEYLYDILMIDTSNNVTRILNGILNLNPGITNIAPPNIGLPPVNET